jgi:hypothetical protein
LLLLGLVAEYTGLLLKAFAIHGFTKGLNQTGGAAEYPVHSV